MSRLLAYVAHHPWLTAGTALVAAVVLAYELRLRTTGSIAVGSAEVVRLMNQGALLIDLRAKEAYEAGHIGEARHLPTEQLDAELDGLKKWRERPVILYCDSGARSAAATRKLLKAGFAQAVSLDGGVLAWTRDNLPLVKGAATKKAGA